MRDDRSCDFLRFRLCLSSQSVLSSPLSRRLMPPYVTLLAAMLGCTRTPCATVSLTSAVAIQDRLSLRIIIRFEGPGENNDHLTLGPQGYRPVQCTVQGNLKHISSNITYFEVIQGMLSQPSVRQPRRSRCRPCAATVCLQSQAILYFCVLPRAFVQASGVRLEVMNIVDAGNMFNE